MRKLWVIGILMNSILLNYSFAQEVHFVRYKELSAMANPALVASEANVKASVINKEQWKSVTNSYKTYGASIEFRILSEGKKGNKRTSSSSGKGFSGINAGVMFISDKAGAGILSRNRGAVSLSSGVKINERNVLLGGVMGSYMQCRLDHSGFLFPNQYNGYGYDANMASKENFVVQQYTVLDVGSGVLWVYDHNVKGFDVNKLFNAHIGFSMYNLVRARSEYIPVSNREKMRFVIHGDLTKSTGIRNMAIAPEFLLQMQGPASELLIGSMVKHYFSQSTRYTGKNKQNSFGYGLYYRVRDALVFSGSLELREQYSFFASYDITISKLRYASNYKGGFEVGIRYTTPHSYLYRGK